MLPRPKNSYPTGSRLLLCKECDYEWMRRVSTQNVVQCPRCRTRDWSIEPRPLKHVGRVGIVHEHKVDMMVIGDELVIPWPHPPDSRLDPNALRRNANVSYAVARFAQDSGRRFGIRCDFSGVIIKRWK